MDHLNEFHIPEDILGRLKDSLFLKKQVEDGKTFQEILGFTGSTMNKFYEAAYSLFKKHHYKEAADAFVFLTTLNPRVHNYWLGLGMSEHLTGEFDAALIAYEMAILTDPNNPLPYYHTSGCYQAVHDKDRALHFIKQAISYSEVSKEHALIYQRAQNTYTALKKQLGK